MKSEIKNASSNIGNLSKKNRKLRNRPGMTRKESKKESYDKIIQSAIALLKVKGIAETSISDVMAGAGLTVGGFYAHFKNKEDLVLKAVHAMILKTNKEVAEKLAQSGVPEKDKFQIFIMNYLSEAHAKNVAQGCPVAAMSREIGRERRSLKREFASLLHATMLERKKLFNQADKQFTDDEWFGVMATYVGALILGRATEGESVSTLVFESAKKFILKRSAI